MPERRILGISLKMYFTPKQTIEYTKELIKLSSIADAHNVDLFFCPDFLGVASASPLLSESNIILGAQHCWENDSGSFTGEVSPMHLAELGVRMVELGHAERRRLFGETDEGVARKAAAAVRNGLVPLVCIGEPVRGTLDEAMNACRPQVLSLLEAVTPESDIVFAYEPVWAIGAAEPASADYVVAMGSALRAEVARLGRPGRVRFIYGGSAGPGLFQSLSGSLDGLFLGRFGHSIDNLKACIEEVGGAR
ncbi:triosephosphate isomerase 2 [Meredithblackwellia eburnea MCA 4105]